MPLQNHDPPSAANQLPWHESRLRVRYPEVDSQGVVHHSYFLHYFEIARTELLRSVGLPYSQLEKDGVQLMVTESALRHHRPARYDEVLRLLCRAEEVTRVRIYIAYRILREGTDELICDGKTVLAGIDPGTGKPTALPRSLALSLSSRRASAS